MPDHRGWWVSGPWLLFLLCWVLAALRVKPAKRRESLLSRLRYTALLALGCYLLFADGLRLGPLSRRFLPESAAVFFAGVVLLIVGIGFAIWARAHLGVYWSGTVTLKQEHRLIRTGPYALVRNPIYTGLLLAALGTAIAFGELRGLLGVALMLASFLIKILIEEAWLTREFGAEYERYRREVPALIPYIY